MEKHAQLAAICQQYQACLLEVKNEVIRIAVTEAPVPELLETLRFTTQKRIEVEQWGIEKMETWRQPAAISKGEHSALQLIDQTLHQAIQRRASDIHVEPFAQYCRIRMRIDGVLHTHAQLPVALALPIAARLKILSSLDIAEKRIPQDGQLTVEIEHTTVSFRVSTLPTRYGEKVVLRLLQNLKQTLEIDKSGMSHQDITRFQHILQSPQGLILVTGPTGSGKTLTLYSALNYLNQQELNLSTVEDPVEIPLEGINQTQINTKAGLNFQTILRALLRQDPDVIMVGEIRDSETAEIALKAAQTGHLVLSTLHTNSTVETFTRLEHMAMPRWLLACAIKLIIAQRLVRRLCPACRKPADTPVTLPASVWPAPLSVWQATGCEHCFSGYYGRVALFELLIPDAVLQHAITEGAPAEAIMQIAQKQGMETLLTAGLHAVEQGITTLDEIYRVVGIIHG